MRADTLFAALPPRGRVFRGARTVRLADAGPDRRVRLDALARFLHDVAEDDAQDADLPAGVGWVLRKTTLTVRRFPLLADAVGLATFCSAVAPRWAERTTILDTGGETVAQGVSVWVAIDASTGAPVRLDQRFHDVFGPSADGRRASARLSLPAPPEGARAAARPWQLRGSDFDVWGHVNNAISWAAVEDATDASRVAPLRAELEHVAAIEPGAVLQLATARLGADTHVWLLDAATQESTVATAARLRPVDLQPDGGPAR